MNKGTRLLKPGADPEKDPALVEAADLIRAGDLVAFPTETVYGLGGDASNPMAVQKIFAAKNRPADNPVIVHAADLAHVLTFVEDPPQALNLLAEAFWPGPLTVVLKAAPHVRESVCRGLNTVAVRVPQHPVAQALIRLSGKGIAAPSANLSGKPSPTKAAHVLFDLDGRIPLILDGGDCKVGLESTVLDLSGPEPLLLRPGFVTAAQLTHVLGHPLRRGDAVHEQERSPGTRYRHYSPDAPVLLLAPNLPQEATDRLLQALLQQSATRVGYIGASPVKAGPKITVTVLDPLKQPEAIYGALRDLDQNDVDCIVVEGVPTEGLGESIMDRLDKAATLRFDDACKVGAFLKAGGLSTLTAREPDHG